MPTERDPSLADGAVDADPADEHEAGRCAKTVADEEPPELVVATAPRAAVEQDPDLSTNADAPEIEGYELLEKLGQGGMGSVWKARQTSLDRLVAIKVLPPLFSRSSKFIQRFRREALATARLHHPNIVTAIDVGVERRDGQPDLYYFVMEYVDGETVGDLIDRLQKLEPEQAVDIAAAVASALGHAWSEAAIVHRDVKPGNILITRNGEVKLADLGLARSAREDVELTTAGLAIGTPHYASPEQALGQKDIDTRSDIYSLGATLFHMLIGQTPFDGDTAAAVMAKHVNEDAPSCHEVDLTVPLSLSVVVSKMMRRNPDERYQAADELLRELQLLQQGGHPLAYTRLLEACEAGGGDVDVSYGFHLRQTVTLPHPVRLVEESPKAERGGWIHAVGAAFFLGAAGFGLWHAVEQNEARERRARASAAVPRADQPAEETPAEEADAAVEEAPAGAVSVEPVRLSLQVVETNEVVPPGRPVSSRLTARSRISCFVRPMEPAYVYLIMVSNAGPRGAVNLRLLGPAPDRPARLLTNTLTRFPHHRGSYPMPGSGSTVAFLAAAGRNGLGHSDVAAALKRVRDQLAANGQDALGDIPARQTLWYGPAGEAGEAWALEDRPASCPAAATLGVICQELRAAFKDNGLALSGVAMSYASE